MDFCALFFLASLCSIPTQSCLEAECCFFPKLNRHREAISSFGLANLPKKLAKADFSSLRLLKNPLWVISWRAFLQSCSIGLRSGEYGGMSRNITLALISAYSLFFLSRIRRFAFLCHGALSRIIYILWPRLRL